MSSPLSPYEKLPETAAVAPLDSAKWTRLVLENLAAASPDGASAVNFIEQRKINIMFRKQKATGAMWSLDGNIYLNSDSFSLITPVTHAFMLSLIAHEALHLKQGIATALSVYGELEAWKLGFKVYQSLGGKIFSDALDELMLLPVDHNREMLRKVRTLMQDYAGKRYRIDLLPLYPVWSEVKYLFTGRIPRD